MDTRAGDPIAEERAALRRVAVLVARGAPPEEVFAALTAEVGRLLDADLTAMIRYDADPVEIAAYYVVCEALVNTARHAHATAADVEVAAGEDVLRVSVRDDGRGGAAFGHGSGLVGLRDRVEALGGRILMDSPPGKGTTVEAHIPVQQGLPGRAATARSGK